MKEKNQEGITLIALIITIIVLLILAGITLNLTIRENGIFNTAQKAAEEHEKARLKEELEVAIVDIQAKKITEGKKIVREDLVELASIGATIENTGIPAEGEYKDYFFEVDENYVVTIIKKVKGEKPNIVGEVTTTGIVVPGGKVQIKVTASIMEGTIISIESTNGAVLKTDTSNTEKVFEVDSNGTYYFKAKAENGRSSDSIAVTVDSIMEGNILEINENVENINTSAKISSIENNIVSIDNSTLKISSITGEYKDNDRVMIYVSNSDDLSKVGKYEIYTIESIDENKIKLSEDINTDIFTNENSQIIKIVSYDGIIIKENAIVTATPYDGESGGIIAIEATNIILNGYLDVSKCGYDGSNLAPNNGGKAASGNLSYAGGSNKYKGGDGGKNYQGYVGKASDAVGLSSDILQNKQMTFGGGSYGNSITIKGGGIIYIDTKKIDINSQYAIKANGAGGNTWLAGGAGGTICIRSKQITLNNDIKDYFVGANAGGGSSEYYSGSWKCVAGEDGTNIRGGNGATTPVKSGGSYYLSNGGGGAQHGYNGYSASSNKGGNGANASANTGYNAGAGGGGGGYVSIYTDSDLSSIVLTDAEIYHW